MYVCTYLEVLPTAYVHNVAKNRSVLIGPTQEYNSGPLIHQMDSFKIDVHTVFSAPVWLGAIAPMVRCRLAFLSLADRLFLCRLVCYIYVQICIGSSFN